MDICQHLSGFSYGAYLASDRERFSSDLAIAIDSILSETGADLDHGRYFSVSNEIAAVLQSYGHKISHVDYDGACNHYGSWEPNANQLYIVIGFKDDPTSIIS